MRSTSAFLACAFLLAASAASAESRVFIIANQADGYGVDQCLAQGEKCGAHAARSYCQSRDFAEASSYRRVDPDEITGSVPKPAGGACQHAGCNQYVAITAKIKGFPATPAPRKRRDAAQRSGYVEAMLTAPLVEPRGFVVMAGYA
jgi:hypothetical protein